MQKKKKTTFHPRVFICIIHWLSIKTNASFIKTKQDIYIINIILFESMLFFPLIIFLNNTKERTQKKHNTNTD